MSENTQGKSKTDTGGDDGSERGNRVTQPQDTL